MALPLLTGPLLALGGSLLGSQPELEWNPRRAEHLLNRAGFGATPEEVAAAVEAGPRATVERLIAGDGEAESMRVRIGQDRLRGGLERPEELTAGPPVEPKEPSATMRRFYLDRGALSAQERVRAYCNAWIENMLAGADPVRDRMALFLHGHFVSQFLIVRDAEDMIRQIDFLRTNSLGDFETLVRGIARDPAMLEYLNNNINVKSHPNENWARELMELFTLGDGNYTEEDIKEVARAYTGWANDNHEFVYNRDLHDYGMKSVLGVAGNLGGADVIDILLERDACGLFLAGKIIAYFEGVAPSEERVQAYAEVLRANDYDLGLFLERLFLDPEFYRDEVLANRVAAPIEYIVGTARRLGIAPPDNVIFASAAFLGQRLFDPPNVKGWEEGMAWLTTGSVMQRSNLIGALFGILGAGDDAPIREFDTNTRLFGPNVARSLYSRSFVDYLAMLAWYQATGWRPATMEFRRHLGASVAELGEAEVEALLERLLAVPAPSGMAARLTDLLTEWRDSESPADDSPEDVVVRLAHVILSLPEAQRN